MMTQTTECAGINELINTCKMPIPARHQLSDYLSNCDKITIYGAGNLGRCIYDILSASHYDVSEFIDKNEDRYPDGQCGKNVYSLQDFPRIPDENDVAILSVMLTRDEYTLVEEQLKEKGFKYIISGYLLFWDLRFAKEQTEIVHSEFIQEKIKEVYGFMEDDESRRIFAQTLTAHVLGEYGDTVCDWDLIQYIRQNVPLRKGYKRFVDVGAFFGDTLDALITHEAYVEEYYAFEPDPGSYQRLNENFPTYQDKIGKAALIPLALSDKNGSMTFSDDGTGTSALSESGRIVVTTARMDDVLRNINPTIIKMDIEGAELSALTGARRIISETQPDLAICVYHKLSDLWDIPLLLKEYVPQYKFWLRSHWFYTLETVLYATV